MRVACVLGWKELKDKPVMLLGPDASIKEQRQLLRAMTISGGAIGEGKNLQKYKQAVMFVSAKRRQFDYEATQSANKAKAKAEADAKAAAAARAKAEAERVMKEAEAKVAELKRQNPDM